MCDQSEAVLRASNQLLCLSRQCGTGSPSRQVTSPPSCLESEENENHEEDVDHSLRFSTPSLFTCSKIESEDNKILPLTLTESDGPATRNQEDYTKPIATPPHPHQSSSLEQRPINSPHQISQRMKQNRRPTMELHTLHIQLLARNYHLLKIIFHL